MTNQAFREHVFGQHFVLTLRQKATQLLARLVIGEDGLAPVLWCREMQQLHDRGLVERRSIPGAHNHAWYPTRAGVLVYELMVEAGEHRALDEARRKALAAQDELHRLRWAEMERETLAKIRLKTPEERGK